ncbi:MAG: replicative DNA helicase, partial [Sphingobacteriales bacterium]|nr:replicative DNA helicase [Sphingobacteriales bacterium]
KFVEDDGEFGGGFNPGGNFRPLPPGTTGGGDEGPKLFIQKGSKMNDLEFDEGFEEETPF